MTTPMHSSDLMTIRLIDAAEGREVGYADLGPTGKKPHIEGDAQGMKLPPDTSILADARRIMALADEMRAEADRIQREADAFWARCRERAAQDARKRLGVAEVV